MSGYVVVCEHANGAYQQDICSGSHHWIAGEPEHLGGNNAGPAPFEFILAALGSCTSITLRMYAERKALPLTQISVKLSHERAESGGRPVERITRQITLTGDLPESARARLLEIAQKCPVHRALSPAFELPCHLTPAVGARLSDTDPSEPTTC